MHLVLPSPLRHTRRRSSLVSVVVGASLCCGGFAAVAVSPKVAWAACEGRAIESSTTTLPMVAEQINAPAAWTQGFDGRGVDVALIDTGVTGVPGLTSAGKFVDAADLSTESGDAALSFRDGEGHGTNMAGIIAGDGSGGPLSKGVAPGARIINVKVGASDGTVDISQVVAGIDWVVQNKRAFGRNIRVISLSYSTDANTDYKLDPLTHAVENAWRAGIVVVVSAGNDGKKLGRLGNPAADPFVMAVGSSAYDTVAKTWTVPDFSAVGNGLRNPDVVAPGVAVASLRNPGSMLDATFPAGRFFDPATCTSFFRGSGTSQSAAATAGAVSLLLQQRPTLSPDQVKALLKNTARSLSVSPTKQGAGIVDVAAALAAPTPDALIATQKFQPSTGTGSLESARGSLHLERSTANAPKVVLTGERTARDGAFESGTWSRASANRAAWTNQVFDANGRLVSGNWSGSTWSGSTWSGSSWSGSSWSGSTWSGSSWSGSNWSGSTWSGSSRSGSTWSGATWS